MKGKEMLCMFRTTILSIAVTLGILSSVSAQNALRGEVFDVLDGRTVMVAIPSGKVKVELQFIDVPIAGEPMSDLVKEHLRGLVQGKNVEYRVRNILSDRTIGRLTVNAIDVSQQMLRDGAAWHMPVRLSGQDIREFDLYASTEAAARSEKRGLWSAANLKPAWERPVIVNTSAANGNGTNTAGSAAKVRGPWGDKNPRMGNVGALVNGYNAETKTGFVGTSLLGVAGTPDAVGSEINLAIGVTYYYKETQKGRSGNFIVTVTSASRKIQFLANNDLWIIGEVKSQNLGRPKRRTSTGIDYFREELTYEVSKASLQKMVDNDRLLLKVGGHLIHLTGIRYLLYNMLQVAD
jgi:endonuclease YncB( thermonuclease family)